MESILSTCLCSVAQGWGISNKLSEGAIAKPQGSIFKWQCWDIGAQVPMQRHEGSCTGMLAAVTGVTGDLLG